MACDNWTKVYLGYEDEYVTDKHRPSINFMTNKIGGFPVSCSACKMIHTRASGKFEIVTRILWVLRSN